MKYTIAEALNEMRQLHGADAGRLRGVEVPYHLDHLTGLDTMPAPWGARLTGLIEARKADIITADTPQYVVYSDASAGGLGHRTRRRGHPGPADVAHPGQTPAAGRRRARRPEPRNVAEAGRRTRPARRTARHQRHRQRAHHARCAAGSTRRRPDRTRWVRVGADLDAARREVARVLGGSDDDTVIVTAVGYGHHGYHAHRLSLELVCAMQTVIAAHPASLTPSATGSTTSTAWPTTSTHRRCRPVRRLLHRPVRLPHHYLQHRMDQQGWTDLLHTNGIQPYFDRRRYELHLFAHEVTAIDVDSWRPGLGIEVFHRRPTT